jgi:hypothetical protein
MKTSHSTLLGSTQRANCPVNATGSCARRVSKGICTAITVYSDARWLAARGLSSCLGSWTDLRTGPPVQFPAPLPGLSHRHQKHFFPAFSHSPAKPRDAHHRSRWSGNFGGNILGSRQLKCSQEEERGRTRTLSLPQTRSVIAKEGSPEPQQHGWRQKGAALHCSALRTWFR